MAEKKQKYQLYVLAGLLVVAVLVWYSQSAKTPQRADFPFRAEHTLRLTRRTSGLFSTS